MTFEIFQTFENFYHRDRGFKRVLCAVAFGGSIGHICRRKIRRPRLARTHGALEVPTNIGRICQRAYLEIWGVFAGKSAPFVRLQGGVIEYKALLTDKIHGSVDSIKGCEDA